MKEIFTEKVILEIFQKVWQLQTQTDIIKSTFGTNDLKNINSIIKEETSYELSDRSYLNLLTGNGADNDSSLEALCAYILLKDGKISVTDLQYKIIDNKTKGLVKEQIPKPPQGVYSTQYYKFYIQRKSIPKKYLGAAAAVVLFASGFLLFWLNLSDSTKTEKTFFEIADSTNLRVLLLPFKPDNQCSDVENALQKTVFDSLINKQIHQGFAIDVIRVNDLNCPTTDDEARRIGKLKNADFVIWGLYETTSQGLIPKLRFSFVNGTMKKRIAENSNSIAMLRDGYFNSSKAEYILDWTLLISLYYKRDLKQAQPYLNRILAKKANGGLSADNLLFLADMCMNIGNFKESSELLKNCLEICETEKQSQTRILALAKMCLIQMFLSDGILTETYKVEAINAMNTIKDDIKYAPAYKEIGYCFLGLQEIPQAIQYFEKALALEINHPKTDSITLASTYFYTGYAYFFGQKRDKAEVLLTKAAQIGEKSRDNSSELLGGVYDILSGIYSSKQDYHTAYVYQLKCLAHSKKVLPNNHVNLGTTYCNLGYTETNIGKFEEANKSFRKALEILNLQKDGYYINGLADTYGGMAVLERKKRNFNAATTYHRKSIALGTLPNQNNPALDKYYYRTADTYKQIGKLDSAMYFIKKSIEIAKQENRVESLKDGEAFLKNIKSPLQRK